jgi:hypothetical protein
MYAVRLMNWTLMVVALQINNAGVLGATAEIDTTVPIQEVVSPLTSSRSLLTF